MEQKFQRPNTARLSTEKEMRTTHIKRSAETVESLACDDDFCRLGGAGYHVANDACDTTQHYEPLLTEAIREGSLNSFVSKLKAWDFF